MTAPPAAPPAADSAAPAPGPAPLGGPATEAHSDGPIVVDRVVAIVGNRPVLASQVDEEVFSRQSQGQSPPKDPDSLAALRKQVVASIVDEELLVQQAQRDTAIKVTDQEIADGVEQQVRKVRGNFTSEVDYKNELKRAGFGTPEEYRRWLTDQQRRAAFQNRLIEKLRADGKLKPVSPTEQEMRAYFNEQKGALGNRPATLSFRQIVIAPRPAPQAKARTRAQADSIVLELRRGADFATAAKRFSQDPGSKDQGGSLNWFRRGVMVPEFERVAFALRPGVVSDPVESPFGYHIIQVERVQPGEVQARHILLIPDIDSVHVDSARALADSVRAPRSPRRAVRLAAAGAARPVGREAGGQCAGGQAARGLRQGIRRRRLRRGGAGVLTARRGHTRAVRGRADHRHGGRRATSATRTCATGSATSSASSSPSGGTSTGCVARPTWRSGHSDAPRHHAGGPARNRSRDHRARAGGAGGGGDHGGGGGGPDRGDSRGTAASAWERGGWGAASGPRIGLE